MIEIKTQEQLVELAARCVYLLTNLRAFQRDFEADRAKINLHKDADVVGWEIRCDEFLKNIEAVDFIPLKQLIEQLKIKINKHNEAIKP